MYEIELKAHITDRENVVKALNSFARYDGSIEKHDTYWHIARPQADRTDIPGSCTEMKEYVSARIRRETVTKSDGSSSSDTVLTYKRKALRTGADGVSSEVNDERECTLSDASPLESLFTDSGFTVAHTKEKYAESWYADTPQGTAHLELCTVPPLGMFLEIEIMSDTEAENRVTQIRTALQKLLLQCGIRLSAVEPRYYTDMIAEYESSHKQR